MPGPEKLMAAVAEADARNQALAITGNGTKAFLGYPADKKNSVLDVSGHTGVIDYRPDELMIRVNAGTTIGDLNDLLASEGQIAGFDPPDFSGRATLGGTLSAGLSGSRRPYAGAVKDFVLGVGLILPAGDYAEFGGQVMKNVAGYDVSRLVCGAFGALGVVADVSLKVLPKPETEITLKLELDRADAEVSLQAFRRNYTVISASCYLDGVLSIRLSGSSIATGDAVTQIGGEEGSNEFWSLLDTHQLSVFTGARDIWRLSTSAREPVEHDFAVLDWGFTQRWLMDPDSDPRSGYRGAGHWTRYRQGSELFEAQPFHPLGETEMAINLGLKKAFDEKRRFNTGRVYQEI
jgi:glycolate oxidase FAD binding subunit